MDILGVVKSLFLARLAIPSARILLIFSIDPKRPAKSTGRWIFLISLTENSAATWAPRPCPAHQTADAFSRLERYKSDWIDCSSSLTKTRYGMSIS